MLANIWKLRYVTFYFDLSRPPSMSERNELSDFKVSRNPAPFFIASSDLKPLSIEVKANPSFNLASGKMRFKSLVMFS